MLKKLNCLKNQNWRNLAKILRKICKKNAKNGKSLAKKTEIFLNLVQLIQRFNHFLRND
jgi:hypothetical protein